MSMSTNPVNWFEIPVNDLAKARQFYEATFDCSLEVQDMGPLQMAWFPMQQEKPGCTGTLVKAEGYTPSHAGSLVYFTVDNIEAALHRINELGGKTLMPKTNIGEYGFIAHFEDCEGNRVALHATS